MNRISPHNALKELGLNSLDLKTIKKNIDFSMIVSLMALTSLVDIVSNDNNAALAVMDKAPKNVTYPDIQVRALYNPENNTFTNVNIFSREHLDKFAKENNLKVQYLDTPENQAINLAIVEKQKKADVLEDPKKLNNKNENKNPDKTGVVEKV